MGVPAQPSVVGVRASLLSPHAQAQQNQLCLIQGVAADKPSPRGSYCGGRGTTGTRNMGPSGHTAESLRRCLTNVRLEKRGL